MKTAIVYDKWLHSLGGGEMVACTIARILLDRKYRVIIISGKPVSPETIKEKLDIDLSGVKFVTIWSDEEAIQDISRGASLFINTTFMDYTQGIAQRNIYYTHFPTEAYMTLKGKIVNEVILPVAARVLAPIEFLNGDMSQELINGKHAYSLLKKNSIAVPHLFKDQFYKLKITLYLNQFTKSALENIEWSVTNAEVKSKKIIADHFHNCIHLIARVKPNSGTIYVNLHFPQSLTANFIPQKYYLINLYAIPIKPPPFILKLFAQKVSLRLRAGIFTNILRRLESYDIILANSQFTQTWIKKYWNKIAIILYPPVRKMEARKALSKRAKRIVSIGRFFTLGHGKKQEVLIEAFKKLHKYQKYHEWELHFIGGVSEEPTSLEFINKLQVSAKGYPIFFHFNAPRKKILDIVTNSQIYWHATGYGEPENHPVKFEHFGIAPVEAMSAGCVPILYKGGGLPEIVRETGLPTSLLYTSVDELVKVTVDTIRDIHAGKYADVAKRVGIFSAESFERQFAHILDEL